MKKILLGIFITIFFAGGALAERYVMVTHTAGTDPFWPVVQKGGEDAAKAIGADFEYMFHPSGDMAEMAKLIVAADLMALTLLKEQYGAQKAVEMYTEMFFMDLIAKKQKRDKESK